MGSFIYSDSMDGEDEYISDAKGYTTFFVTHAKVSENITSIGMATFSYFSNLTNVVLPNSLKSIGTKKCTGIFGSIKLNNLTIPKNVTSMTTEFGSNIKNLYVESESLTEVGNFTDFSGTIYVRNDAMKTLFENNINSSKAKVSTNYNW